MQGWGGCGGLQAAVQAAGWQARPAMHAGAAAAASAKCRANSSRYTAPCKRACGPGGLAGQQQAAARAGTLCHTQLAQRLPKRTLPMARSPRSKKNSTPRIRKRKPRPVRPTPISAAQQGSKVSWEARGCRAAGPPGHSDTRRRHCQYVVQGASARNAALLIAAAGLPQQLPGSKRPPSLATSARSLRQLAGLTSSIIQHGCVPSFPP